MKSIITLYIHQIPGEPQQALVVNMSRFPEWYGALLGQCEVEVEWQEVDADPAAILIDRYQHELMQEGADHDERAGALMERIQGLRLVHKMMLIEHDQGDA